MKHKTLKQSLALILTLVMIASCLVSPAMASPAEATLSTNPAATLTQSAEDNRISPTAVSSDLNEEVTIMVKLDGDTAYMQTKDLQVAVASEDTMVSTMAQAESRIEATLSESIEIKDRYSLLFNGFSFVGEAWMIDAINEMDGVTAFRDFDFQLVEPTATDVVAAPNMSMSTDLTATQAAWELGYTGEGMVVAILDTGIRQTHEAFSVMPENGRMDMAYLTRIYDAYGSKIHAGNGTMQPEMYYSEKLPFNWDYFDNNAVPNHTASDHGTHVAGIVAGNNGQGFKGIAPDAQIVTMQVFADNGGASFSTLMLALEDCVYLGVDAINMSLGVTAYFTGYESIDAYLETIYDNLEAAGVAVCAAAGNDTHTNPWNNYGDFFYSQYYWSVLNPDVGIIGAPATFPGSFAVASVVNGTRAGGGYLNVAGMDYYPGTANSANTGLPNPTLGEMQAGEYDMVYIGLGSPEEIAAAGGVEGKIALVQRGTLTFSDKCTNAANAGAVAVILFNNASGRANPSVHSDIPFGNLSMEEGLEIIATFPDGVSGKVKVIPEFGYGTVSMARSSSWGTTADLKIKPEIASPGDNITSAIGFGADDTYQTWSGTSMATPAVAGGILLIKQALMERMPTATPAEINTAAINIMMSTAHQVSGMVRQQGAGLIDVESAVSTDAYLSVNGGRPKLELDDSENGVFTFSLEVNNIGKTDKTYVPNLVAMTESVSMLYGYSGHRMIDHAWNERYNGSFLVNPTAVDLPILSGTPKNVTKLVKMDAPETVTVKSGEKVTINITLTCSEELMTWFRENCPVGMYLEGYIKLIDQAEDGIDLSAPFLGFVGDWDYVPMFDQGFWWQIPYGQNNMAQMSTSQGTFVGYGMRAQGLGINPYWDATGQTYLADRNAISPNGDDYLDAVNYVEFALMRNPKTVKAYITDAEGNVLQNVTDATYVYRKEYYDPNMWQAGVGFSNVKPNFTGAELEENETAYIVIEGYLDHDEYDVAKNMNGRMTFPVTKDTTAPQIRIVDKGIEIVDAQYTAYYAIYADAEKTELLYENGVFATERGVATLYETDLDTFYVFTADYARNEAFYMVSEGAVVALEGESFFGEGKTIVGRQYFSGNYAYYTYSWMEFNSKTAVNVKKTYVPGEANGMTIGSFGFDYFSACIDEAGTVYVNSLDSLYTQNPETMELTWVADWIGADGKSASVYNLMMNPETFECYGLIWYQGVGVCVGKVDLETGVITFMWDITGYAPDGYNTNKNSTWGACLMDGQTVAIHCHIGYLAFFDLQTGTFLYHKDMEYNSPLYGASMYGINGVKGNMFYSEEDNCFYIFSNWQWFRYHNPYYQGMIVFDMDTETASYVYVGDGTDSFHGLYFKEDVKPQDWYAVIMLIDAIGEVTTESGEAIEAAREAYDALSDEDKARVTNYETLVQAEHRYCIVMGEKYANDAKKSAEDAQKAYEDAKKEAEEAKKAAEEAKKAYEDAVKETAENKEAAEKAQKAAEEAQKKAEEAQAKAETAKAAAEAAQAKAEAAQKAAEDAAKAAEESNKKAAQEALKAAEEAAKAAEESAKAATSAAEAAASANEAAKSAQAAAEAQAKAQAAQAAAEKAQKAAEEAQKKAEEAQKKAEEAAESAAEDKEAAEKAAEAAKEAQEAAEKAKEAAQQAQDAAAASAAAAEESNKAAAESAALAAQYAQEVTEMYLEIVKMKAEMTDMLAAAQKAQEAAEAAALASAKYYALTEITALTLNVEGYTQHQLDELAAAVKAAQEAIEAATTIAEVETIVEDLKATLETIAASCPAKVFTDVAEDAWYHEAVDYVVLAGMMNGKAADIFAPNANLTRAELVTVLYRMAGEPSVEGLKNPFTDVAADTWYTDAVIWAYHAEVVKGISETAFAPDANITREQIATILYRYAEAEEVEEDALAGYADAAKVSSWASDAMNWAVSVGLINGMDETTLAPQGNATRAQIATILMRYCEG